MKKLLVAGSILCLGVFVFTYAVSAMPGMMGPPGGHRGIHKNPYGFFKNHAEEIGLTEDQLNQIEQLSIEAEKKMIELRSQIETLRVDMHAEMENDKPDRSVVFKLLDEINTIHGELKKTGITLVLDIRDILSPEQWKIAKEIREAKMAERMKMRGKGLQGGNEQVEF